MPFSLHDFAAVLTQKDLDAMPEALRCSFNAWYAQRRTLRGPSQAPVPARTSLDEIACEMLRVIAGQAPASSVEPWLDRFDDRPGHAGVLAQHVGVLVGLAVAGRHLDLLNTLLDRPTFCPGSSATRLRTLRQQDRGPNAETFDGSLRTAYGHPARLGLEVALLATHAVSDPIPGREPWLSPEDPLIAWCRSQDELENAWDRALCAMVPARGERDGFRQQAGSNVVGQAVLLGWADGVRALLGHDVDPYARPCKGHAFTSPLILAGVHREIDCVRALLEHPSFELEHRFGFTHAEVERRRMVTDDPCLLWGRGRAAPCFPESGGLDVEFVLREPALMSDTLIPELLLQHLKTMPPRAQQRFRHELSATGQRALETMELHATARGVPTSTVRSRARL